MSGKKRRPSRLLPWISYEFFDARAGSIVTVSFVAFFIMLAIGITGHRPNRLVVSDRKLGLRIRKLLRGLASGIAGAPETAALDVISPLAEGCDRIVAREVVELGQKLTALLPFDRKQYEATFSGKAAISEFRSLLKKADVRFALESSFLRPELGYLAAGVVTVARADVVLTIWDGKPAAGRGGTPEILQLALEWGIPILWVHAQDDKPPLLLRQSPRSRAKPVLEKIAREGKVVTPNLLRRLARELNSPSNPARTASPPRRPARG